MSLKECHISIRGLPLHAYHIYIATRIASVTDWIPHITYGVCHWLSTTYQYVVCHQLSIRHQYRVCRWPNSISIRVLLSLTGHHTGFVVDWILYRHGFSYHWLDTIIISIRGLSLTECYIDTSSLITDWIPYRVCRWLNSISIRVLLSLTGYHTGFVVDWIIYRYEFSYHWLDTIFISIQGLSLTEYYIDTGFLITDWMHISIQGMSLTEYYIDTGSLITDWIPYRVCR